MPIYVNIYICIYVCMYVSTSVYNHRCLRHSSVYVSDLKIEVTFPRPGDTLVPPVLQSQRVRVTSRSVRFRSLKQTRQTSCVLSWGLRGRGSSRPPAAFGGPLRRPVEAVRHNCHAPVGRIGFLGFLSPPFPRLANRLGGIDPSIWMGPHLHYNNVVTQGQLACVAPCLLVRWNDFFIIGQDWWARYLMQRDCLQELTTSEASPLRQRAFVDPEVENSDSVSVSDLRPRGNRIWLLCFTDWIGVPHQTTTTSRLFFGEAGKSSRRLL